MTTAARFNINKIMGRSCFLVGEWVFMVAVTFLADELIQLLIFSWGTPASTFQEFPYIQVAIRFFIFVLPSGLSLMLIGTLWDESWQPHWMGNFLLGGCAFTILAGVRGMYTTFQNHASIPVVLWTPYFVMTFLTAVFFRKKFRRGSSRE